MPETNRGERFSSQAAGKCNFTNTDVGPEHYVSRNPHFALSALSRFGPQDILAIAADHEIRWEEREHGRIFTTESSALIRDMLVENAREPVRCCARAFPRMR